MNDYFRQWFRGGRSLCIRHGFFLRGKCFESFDASFGNNTPPVWPGRNNMVSGANRTPCIFCHHIP